MCVGVCVNLCGEKGRLLKCSNSEDTIGEDNLLCTYPHKEKG